MKKNFYFLFLIGILSLHISAIAQKTVVVVEPDAGLNIGSLNNAIANAADPGNTIFELKRGGLYLLNGAISHTGYTLHIRAEAGTGTRPVLQPAVDDLGASSNHFNPGGSITLESLYIQGRNELGAVGNRQIIISGNENRIIIDDCIFDYSNQTFLRFGSSGNKVYITNSIFRNSVRPENPNNGRIMDTRGNPQDTISVENSTIYNCFAELFRLDGAFINYFNFNHNTVFQSGLAYNINIDHSLIANITNNIFYNFTPLADPHSHHALFQANYIDTVGVYTDADRHFNLSNNNYYNQQEFGDILEQYGNDILYRFDPSDTDHSDTIWYRHTLRTNFFGNPAIIDTITVSPLPALWKLIVDGQVDTSNVFREQLTFKNMPPLNLDYWRFFVENDFNIGSLTPPNAFADEDPSVIGEVTSGAFDFGYNAESKSATAADDGLPLGDPRWSTFIPTSLNKIDSKSLLTVTAFPNPAGDNLTFKIESANNYFVQIAIYNLNGQVVFIKTAALQKGSNLIRMNMENISVPGIYSYSVQSILTGKCAVLTSGKFIKK